MTSGNESPLRFRRTKIVATLGPASSSESIIGDLLTAGVNVFRLNMSHGSHDEHRVLNDRIRAAAKLLGVEIAILADLCGPKIRVGHFERGQVTLISGSQVTVTTRQVTGTESLIVSQYLDLASDVNPGDRLLLDDGNIELSVRAVAGTEIQCAVVQGGVLKDKKGMNLPRVRVSAPALTEKDRTDALFACQLGVDFIALSFVRKASDVVQLRQLVAASANPPLLVAKIEKPEALDVIDEILAVSDAIMVARGDLGVELDPERVPNVQEELVDVARAWQKPVIVATQMLESMITQARPTRAEVTDVANAVRSGADAVMLSAETAAGAHPIDAVRIMDLVIRRTEDYLFSHGAFASIEAYTPTDTISTGAGADPKRDPEAAIALAAARLSRELKTSAIIAEAASGRLLGLLCAQRPAAMVFALSGQTAARSLGCLTWGVRAIARDAIPNEAMLGRTLGLARSLDLEHSGGFLLAITSQGGKWPSLSVLADGTSD